MESTEFEERETRRIAAFLRGIGLVVRRGEVGDGTFLPGIRIEAGTLVVEEARLSYRGDLLDEAGHLAVLPAARRNEAGPEIGGDGGEEMAAIAWSYAAALHLGLGPAVVFHPAGYRGGAQPLLDNFRQGRYIGVPLLEWMGLTADARQARALGVEPYPHMLGWLRA
jgi:hypothetical protein